MNDVEERMDYLEAMNEILLREVITTQEIIQSIGEAFNKAFEAFNKPSELPKAINQTFETFNKPSELPKAFNRAVKKPKEPKLDTAKANEKKENTSKDDTFLSVKEAARRIGMNLKFLEHELMKKEGFPQLHKMQDGELKFKKSELAAYFLVEEKYL